MAKLVFGMIAMMMGRGDGGAIAPNDTADRLAFQDQPENSAAGVRMGSAVRVAVLDAAGNVVTSSNAEVSLALDPNPGGAILLGTTNVNAVAGVATFDDLRLEVASVGYGLTATSNGLDRSTSSAFTVVHSTPAALAFVSLPPYVEANAEIDPAVEVAVQDAFGNTVIDAAAEIVLALSGHARGGELHGPAAAVAVGGVATFEGLSIDRSGTAHELNAATTSLAGIAEGTLDVRFTWTDVRAGELHSCGLQVTGRPYCWGNDSYGELGDGKAGVAREIPGMVAGDPIYTAIRAGRDYTCAIAGGGVRLLLGTERVGAAGRRQHRLRSRCAWIGRGRAGIRRARPRPRAHVRANEER